MPRGRKPSTEPKKRDGYIDITTRVTSGQLNHLHAVKNQLNMTLTDMFDLALQTFFAKRPYDRGMPWRETQALSRRVEVKEVVEIVNGKTITSTRTETEATGWVQLNMRLKPEWKPRLEGLAAVWGVSVSTVLHTMVHWWTWHEKPIKETAERRDRERAEWGAIIRRRLAGGEKLEDVTADLLAKISHTVLI